MSGYEREDFDRPAGSLTGPQHYQRAEVYLLAAVGLPWWAWLRRARLLSAARTHAVLAGAAATALGSTQPAYDHHEWMRAAGTFAPLPPMPCPVCRIGREGREGCCACDGPGEPLADAVVETVAFEVGEVGDVATVEQLADYTGLDRMTVRAALSALVAAGRVAGMPDEAMVWRYGPTAGRFADEPVRPSAGGHAPGGAR
jgi:hypothetical protein